MERKSLAGCSYIRWRLGFIFATCGKNCCCRFSLLWQYCDCCCSDFLKLCCYCYCRNSSTWMFWCYIWCSFSLNCSCNCCFFSSSFWLNYVDDHKSAWWKSRLLAFGYQEQFGEICSTHSDRGRLRLLGAAGIKVCWPESVKPSLVRLLCFCSVDAAYEPLLSGQATVAKKGRLLILAVMIKKLLTIG